jgi:hypothetical protein
LLKTDHTCPVYRSQILQSWVIKAGMGSRQLYFPPQLGANETHHFEEMKFHAVSTIPKKQFWAQLMMPDIFQMLQTI